MRNGKISHTLTCTDRIFYITLPCKTSIAVQMPPAPMLAVFVSPLFGNRFNCAVSGVRKRPGSPAIETLQHVAQFLIAKIL